MNNRVIQELTDKDWLLLRPQNIIGSVQEIKQSGYILKNDKFIFSEYYIVPGFLKICNEIIDNSVDVFIKSGGKSATKIDITMTDTTVKVRDNGYGIPVEKNANGKYIPYIAWGRPRAGSNFDDKNNQAQLGANGIGSYATAVFSKEFIGTTCDGSNKMVVTFKDNMDYEHISTPVSCRLRGTQVEFKPDFERFGLSKITENYKNAIKQRLYHISYSYPGITFTFNGEVLKVDVKSYFSKFSEEVTLFQGQNYSVAFFPNESDDFSFFAYTNGLANTKGGTQIDYFLDKMLPLIRDKIARKFKDIKNADIKNKMSMVVILKDFREPKFDSQSKEMLTSTSAKITEHIGKIDFAKWGEVLYKNKGIVDKAIEIFQIKEAYKNKQELSKLKDVKKKIKSDKYYPPTEKRKYLMVCEGLSAAVGLMTALGRKQCGYYELRGKPLNAYEHSQQKFRANRELSELYSIMTSEGYDHMVMATDQDLDGFIIRGQLLGFAEKYMKEELKKGSIGMLQTPIMAEVKNDMPVKWVYDINEGSKLTGNVKYYKGLGSHTEKGLKYIVSKDGLEKMVDFFTYDEDALESIDTWLNSKNSDKRKEKIILNDFDLIKI